MFCQSALGLLSKLDILVRHCDFVQCGKMCFVQNYYISYSFIVINILFREKDSIFPCSNNRHKETLRASNMSVTFAWSDAVFLSIFSYSLPMLQHWH